MERKNFGPWEVRDSLGRGGQGEVFLVSKRLQDQAQLVKDLDAVLFGIAKTYNVGDRYKLTEKAVSLIRTISTESCDPVGALKLLHPIADPVAAQKASGRMAQEVSILAALEHPSLLRLQDSSINERWFVTEYFRRGNLAGHLARTRGDLLASLLAFRPLVEAVSILHSKNHVHRDIKPENIFVGDDGRLVLGDFGLVIDPKASEPRLTDTYENVGSRDWMPPWAMGMRMDDVRPTFDVFSLGKVLWALISGKHRLLLWYHHDAEHQDFDLEKQFPNDPTIAWVTMILDKCVVERERDCLPNAADLLIEVDRVIEAVKYGGQILRKDRPFRCKICGIGFYQAAVPADRDLRTFCNNCGSMQVFAGYERRPGWH